MVYSYTKGGDFMTCPKCQSENVIVDVKSETNLKQKHHSIVYWIFIGWWLQPFLWFFMTLPMLIISIFKPKSYKTTTTHRKMAICQSCGHSWEIK